ncbi:wuho [Carabus blaptoides fortunei]
MTLLSVKNNTVIICTNERIISYNIIDNTSTEITIPPLECPSHLTKNQQDVLKNEKTTVLATSFSKYGDLFAICTLNKQLVVYNSEYKVLKNLNVARTVSKIRFTPSNNIIIADKTGDVYFFDLKSENCEAEQILGHLSMLLDALVTDCEKFIITCDRDEKIRVSHFPGAYNIVSYCLGHDEFVLNLELLNEKVLISSSGDGTVRFWNYLEGKQLKIINTNDHIKDTKLLEKFSEFMDTETVDVTSLPITSMKVITFESDSIIVVSLYNFNGVQIYQLNSEIDVHVLQILSFDSKLLSFDLTNDKLYILTEDSLQEYVFDGKLYKLTLSPKLTEFYTNCKDMVNNAIKENISVLYKRKYDNVQDYQERKKLRIENQKK